MAPECAAEPFPFARLWPQIPALRVDPEAKICGKLGPDMTEIAILILAAGQSTRMGNTDKLMADVDGKPLLHHVVRNACDAAQGPILVCLPALPHRRYEALAGFDVTPIPVPDAAEGMNASLRAGIAQIPESCGAVLVLLSDMPDLTRDDIKTIVQAIDLTSDTLIWRATTEDGKPGHPVVFSRALFPKLLALRGDQGAQEVVRNYRDRLALVALPGQHARLDLDTPEDWKNWRAARS